MKVDLHTHTVYSYDACSSLKAYIRFAQRSRLGYVAVTDHNEIEGALALRRMAPFQVIVGEEVKTELGDLIGLFLAKRIPPGLTVLQTIGAIKEQGGLVYVPHPSWISKNGRESVASHIDREALWIAVDGIEVLNGRTLQPQPSQTAISRALEYKLFQGAGSDAHTPLDLGRAYVEMESFDTPTEFLSSLANARCFGKGGSRQHRVILNRFVRKAARSMLGTTG